MPLADFVLGLDRHSLGVKKSLNSLRGSNVH